MKKIILKKIFVLFIFIIIIALSGCSKSSNISVGIKGGKVFFPMYNKVNNLNPYLYQNSSEKMISFLLFDSLAIYDQINYRFKNLLMKKIVFNRNGNIATVLLKDNLFDSMGNPITSDTVVRNFNFLKKISNENEEIKVNYLKKYEFKKIDDYTFKIIKKDNSSISHYNLIVQLPIFSESLLKSFEKNEDLFFKFGDTDFLIKNKIAFTGPWTIENISKEEIYLNSNKYYYETDKKGNKLPYLNSIHFKYFSSLDDEMKNFLSGNLGIVRIDPDEYKIFKNIKKEFKNKLIKIPQKDRFYLLIFNYNVKDDNLKYLFFNEQFRNYLYSVIDFKKINKVLFDNLGYIYQFVFYEKKKFTEDFKDNKLLQKNFNLKNIKLKISYYNKDKIAEKIVDIIKSNIGDSINIIDEPLEPTVLVAKIYATGDWDILIQCYEPEMNNLPSYEFLLPDYYEHIMNLKIYKNSILLSSEKKIMEVINKIYSPEFFNNSNQLLDELSRIINKTKFFIPIITKPIMFAYKPFLKNFIPVYYDNFFEYSEYKFIYTYIESSE